MWDNITELFIFCSIKIHWLALHLEYIYYLCMILENYELAMWKALVHQGMQTSQILKIIFVNINTNLIRTCH